MTTNEEAAETRGVLHRGREIRGRVIGIAAYRAAVDGHRARRHPQR
jgi:hypothetical protein